MPAISLVVCVYKETVLLERLLHEAADCYDDLVVVHDGPDTTNVREIVSRTDGRFFENTRMGSLEAQSPFAWERAKQDWILRLDADEFPSKEMKQWLRHFRSGSEPAADVSGYTCIWPLWNGTRTITKRWPAGRIFLFNRQRVRFFGLIEQTPIADGHYETLPIILHHQPDRKSYGLGNLLARPQAWRWRSTIAHSLLAKPTDLPCWRRTTDEWPQVWKEIRERPLRTALYRLTIWPLLTLRQMFRSEKKIIPGAVVSGGVHHCLIALKYWWIRKS